MNILIPVIVGGLFTAGLYMILRRSIVKLLFGIALLTHASNLLVFSAGGLMRGEPPIVDVEQHELPEPIGQHADPLPQAMVLTVIVIGFGVLAFSVMLVYRTYETTGTEDLDRLTTTER